MLAKVGANGTTTAQMSAPYRLLLLQKAEKMKIGIIGFTNLRYMPYLRYYTDLFDRVGFEYEILYWDRRGLNEEWSVKTIAFKERVADSALKTFKFSAMLKFRQFAKTKIIDRQYNFLIILTTLPAVLLGSFLRTAYSDRYVVDIRDYTYEKFSVYHFILKSILAKAAMRVISSPSFKNFLPSLDYTCLLYTSPSPRDA